VFLSAIKKNWRGDPLDEKPLLVRLGLHAAEICLPMYSNLNICAPLQKDIAVLVKQMGKASSFVVF
jgi:hypothetical protein